MFANVLIANRGEIACRIIRTARRMGMKSIALHTPADRGALFTRLADEAHEIGEGANGYLDQAGIIGLAKKVGADCLHPGYGFLSENADFAEGCEKAGVVFVGPPPEAMRMMGLKSSAKALMQRAGVPVVPGYHGDNQNPKFLREKAYEIGYPVLIKAIAGGGGRGMRRVDAHVEFDAALESAIREAEAAFGDGRVLIENSRMLHSAVHYPSNYGFIPQTYCQDRDPLDILVLSQEPVIPGCVMKARPIGMLRMIDQRLEDIKIIAAHADDPMFSNYNDISQLPPHVLLEIRHFFEIYKELEKAEKPQVEEFQGRVDAYRAIRDALALYQRHRDQLFKGEYPDI